MALTYNRKIVKGEQATLADLRQIVDDTKHLPPDSPVGARIAFGRSAAGGSRLTEIIVHDPTNG